VARILGQLRRAGSLRRGPDPKPLVGAQRQALLGAQTGALPKCVDHRL